MTSTLGMETWKTMPMTFPFSSGMTLFRALATSTEGSAPIAIMPQLPRGAIHHVLGGSDGMDCGHESPYDVKIVMGTLGAMGIMQLVVQEALLTILRKLHYFS